MEIINSLKSIFYFLKFTKYYPLSQDAFARRLNFRTWVINNSPLKKVTFQDSTDGEELLLRSSEQDSGDSSLTVRERAWFASVLFQSVSEESPLEIWVFLTPNGYFSYLTFLMFSLSNDGAFPLKKGDKGGCIKQKKERKSNSSPFS